MSLPSVLITHPLPVYWIESLSGRVRIIMGKSEKAGISEELIRELGNADGLFTMLTDRIDQRILDQAPNLKVISNMAVGFDNIDVEACTAHGIPVGNTPGVLTNATADLAFTLLLCSGRGIQKASTDARNGNWKDWSPIGWLGSDFNKATLGIVGMGKIGSAVARRGHAFGMKIIYADPHPNREVETELDAMYCSFTDLLTQADFISLHCLLSESTRGLINEAALSKMKRSAFLVNTSRGPVIVTDSLVKALRDGWIAGAALDVTDPEPLPADHPLYGFSNCLIVPHIGSATYGTRRRMAELACENLLSGLEGRVLPNCVNPQVYK